MPRPEGEAQMVDCTDCNPKGKHAACKGQGCRDCFNSGRCPTCKGSGKRVISR